VKFGLFADPDTTRYCYLRLRLLKAAVKDAKVLDALVEDLELAGATGRKRMPAIERRIDELRSAKDSLWYDVPALEILAALIFKAGKRTGGAVADLFKPVSQVRDLAAPLAQWLHLAGLTTYSGGVPGIGRANVVGYRDGHVLAGARIVGIEAINNAGVLARALDEMKTSREHTHASYVACTPALAAEFLWDQATASGATHWDAEALRRRLQACGGGLFVVEGDAVAQAILPKERRPDKAMLSSLATSLATSLHSPSKGDK